MARIFTEGFEMKDFIGYIIGGGVSITTTNPRSGIAAAGLNDSRSLKRFTTAVDEMYIRTGIKINGIGNQRIIWYKGSTELGSIRTNAESKLGIYVGSTLKATGSLMLAANVWYLLEVHVKIADEDGIIEARVEGGAVDVTFSGDTKPGADADIDNIVWYGGSGGASLDDLAINDISGTVDNSWCGDGKVVMLTPNANGDLSQLMGSDADQIDNYLLVDEFPKDDDTTYVEGSVVDEKDLYNLTDFGLNEQAIKRVWAEARARDTVADAGLVALALKTYDTEYVGPDVTLFTTFTKQILGTVHTVNPNTSAAWTPAELDALQAGPVTRS